MADEIQTDTTETPNSTTPETVTASEGGSATQGGTDAAKPAGATADDDEDQSILGDAKTGDGSGEDEGGAGGEGGDDAAAKADGPPEAYDLKLTTTGDDGQEVEVDLDPVLLEKAAPLLKDAGLSNDQAQKLVALVPDIQRRMEEQQGDAFTALRSDWAKAAEADAEIGGKNWKETQGLAARALDHFGAPSQKDEDGKETNEFRVLLNQSGLGNHPEMLRMFRKIGAALGEDSSLVRADAPPARKKDRLEEMYPDDVPTKQKQS